MVETTKDEQMHYTRLHCDATGESRFEDHPFEFQLIQYAPPTPSPRFSQFTMPRRRHDHRHPLPTAALLGVSGDGLGHGVVSPQVEERSLFAHFGLPSTLPK